MNKNSQSPTNCTNERRGSTLVIVIALLGLLAFTGVVFFTFASSERQAAEYFSEAAKGEVDAPDNVWDHPLRQIISGTSNSPSDRPSILRSTTRRHSMTTNLVGGDLSPHSGEGVHLIMQNNLPRVDMDRDGDAGDEPENQLLLDFVDSPSVWMGDETRSSKVPAPDVDYTSPDINNLFLAYKGWAIRDNGGGSYERVPIIIPSFFRPQYMKTGGSNGFGGNSTPTDINWAQTAGFPQRSFRPNPQHIAGFMPDGTTEVYRYLTAAEATSLGITSGAFPFVPADNAAGKPGGMNGYQGELGVWTGSDPEAYELDADPDGDGIREGIWIDTHFPVQEHVDGSGTTRLYVVMHSFTIYDLDGLIDLNVHGNLAGLDRSENLKSIAATGVRRGFSLSRSNQGLGPNEINPIWALRRPIGPLLDLTDANYTDVRNQLSHHFGQLPVSALEQANMEWIWLMSGRAQIDAIPPTKLEDIFTGRWGEAERIFNTYKPTGGSFQVWDLPRPGASGNAQQMLSAGIRFGGPMFGPPGGRNGFDDNQDALDGEIAPGLGRIRPFGTPMDYAGTGRIVDSRVTGYNPGGGTFIVAGDPRIPILHHDAASTGPERFQAFDGYSMTRDINASNSRYAFGQNGTFDNATGDDLIANPNLDALFEDPLESVFDAEISQKNFDAVFGPQDTPALHLTDADIGTPPKVSERMVKLAPYALDRGNAPFSFYEQVTPGVRSRFTTVSNSLHRFMMRSPFGLDGQPGVVGVDDNGDGIVDNVADLTDPATSFVSGVGDSDSVNRAWEFSADADGNDRDGDGFPDGDGFYEFPPAFGTTPTTGKPYSGTDPFRPQVRRLLSMEVGEGRGLFGQMPLSINHILDVERNNQTPADGTPEFLYYMQRAGMRFRPLIDHPSATEGAAITGATAIPATAAFPPTTPEQREFWARRDRQKLARDIYVLLYSTGGAGVNSAGTNILSYTAPNDPTLADGVRLYTHEQLRRMAQFAVNLVDAMDSDNVITKFEYDKNLGNGWNLDDDSGTADFPIAVPTDSDFLQATRDGIYREDQTVNGSAVPADRGVVYGVEAQELAFSETQGIRSKSTTGDNASTPYDDSAMDRDFLFIELQNVRPTTVTLGETVSNTADSAIWRLARFDRANATDAVEPMAAPDEVLAVLQHPQNVIDGGGRFSIGVSNDTGLATSSFFVDIGTGGAFDGTYELIAPDAATLTLPTTMNQTGTADPGYEPLVDIDVNHQDHNGAVGAPRLAAPSGNFLEGLITPYGGNSHIETLAGNKGTFTSRPSVGFDLVLQRRANPNMPQLSIGDNPWIDVDRTRVEFDDFAVQNTDMPTDIYNPAGMPSTDRLVAVKSTERKEPLDDTDQVQSTPKSATGYRGNTIKGESGASKSDMVGINSRSLPNNLIPASTTNPALPFETSQLHFDREYSSSAELLHLPLVGPNLLTQRLNRMRYAPYRQVHETPPGLGPLLTPPDGMISTEYLSSAEAMFLQPVFPTVTPPPSIEVKTARDNRWYRLFQFVEVPSRVHRMLGNYLTLQRIPGKLNVNMIRHREVLAGLIDNPLFADVPPLNDAAPVNYEEDGPFLQSTPFAGDSDIYPYRDAWVNLIKERDGSSTTSFNPTTLNADTFWLPATANATPFRSYGFQGASAANDNGIEQTLLRRMWQDRSNDVDDKTNRHWLEVGSATYHQLPGDHDIPPDFSEEHRFASGSQRHQVLSKVLNNTTTVSNCFIAYGVAAYFEAYEEPTTGLIRVGGRYDLDQDGDAANDEQRAVFIIDRTEAFNAYDPGTNDFDWKRLVKNQVIIK